jgi:hypothetical protein
MMPLLMEKVRDAASLSLYDATSHEKVRNAASLSPYNATSHKKGQRYVTIEHGHP